MWRQLAVFGLSAVERTSPQTANLTVLAISDGVITVRDVEGLLGTLDPAS
jgi:hypothetical protein